MRIIKRIVEGYRKRVRNPHYIKRLFRKNHSRIKKTATISNPEYVVVGKKVIVLSGARIECYPSFAGEQLSPKLVIEDGVIIGPNFNALISNLCTIGKDTIIAHGVTLVTGNHGMDPESIVPFHSQPLLTKEIRIGSNCWLGCNVVFLGGASVGNNCVVAAGSVVNKQFPDNVIIAGVPAKIIKQYNYQKHQWEKQ